MFGTLERLLGVQRLDPAINDLKKELKEIELKSELLQAFTLYDLNQNNSDRIFILEAMNKLNLKTYDLWGKVYVIEGDQIILNKFKNKVDRFNLLD